MSDDTTLANDVTDKERAAAAATPFHSTACALIIGINRYGALDASKNLKGGAQDAYAVGQCCAFLGMRPERIRTACNDVESPGNALLLPDLGDTTQKGIYEQIDWLRGELEAGNKGLLWYSGHGAHTVADGLLLCPSDTTPELGNTIPFKELGARLGPKAAANLTVVLDCCHGTPQPGNQQRPTTSLGGDPVDHETFDKDLQIGAVVLSACAPGEQAQQSWFAGAPHGAFTWALLSVANQWVAQQVGSNVTMTLSYWQLIKKATALLETLEFDQTPQIWPQYKGGTQVLGSLGGQTAAHPNADRVHIQTDPGTMPQGYRLYTWTDTSVVPHVDVAYTLVSNVTQSYSSTGNAYAQGTEFWRVVSGNVPTKLSWTDVASFPTTDPLGALADFQNPRVVFTSQPTPQGTPSVTQFLEIVDDKLGVDWGLTYPPTAGSLGWYSTTKEQRPDLTILSATYRRNTPIQVKTSTAHKLATGDQVVITGVGPNPTTNAINGTWKVTVAGGATDVFSLDSSTGSGSYTANTGQVQVFGHHFTRASGSFTFTPSPTFPSTFADSVFYRGGK